MGQIVKVYKDGIGYQVLNTDNIGAALEAGDNISIDGNEISAVDTTYSAGTGLSLSGTTFSLNVDYGADLSLSIDPSTFVLTAQLKNQNGGNIGTTQTIDLPLESMVVSGSYNAQTKEVELTLQSGSVIRFSVADLVSGLQEELVVGNGINIDANNEISVDTSVIATKEYVDDSTSAVSGLTTTQPSNPSEGSIYYDSVNDVVKIYDGTNWIEVDTDTEYTAGTGIDIDANNEISVDTSVIATKEYVDDSIAESVSSGATAPSNPTEGQLWYDTTNDVLKVYDGTNWNEVGGDTYTAGTGISIDSNNEISADTSVIATKQYVDDSIAESVSSGATAPSNPTEGQIWYDTTNDVLKVYDGTNWNEIGSDVYTAGTGIDITNNVISADTTTIATKSDLDEKQDLLTAGDNITIQNECVTENNKKGPCPSGFHVPTYDECNNLINAGITIGAWASGGGDSFKAKMKMPYSGYRSGPNSTNIVNRSYMGFVWTCEGYAIGNPRSAYCLLIGSGNLRTSGDYRQDLLNIRPFKNTGVAPDSSWTTIYDGSSTATGAGIFHNAELGLISISTDGTTRTTIADKNLGATTVYNDGDTLSEANCGKYYQWGNNYGFQWDGNITNVSTTPIDGSSYGPNNYYYNETLVRDTTRTFYDWSTVRNDNVWGGTSQGTFQDCSLTISAAGGITYTAGNNIDITNNVISAENVIKTDTTNNAGFEIRNGELANGQFFVDAASNVGDIEFGYEKDNGSEYAYNSVTINGGNGMINGGTYWEDGNGELGLGFQIDPTCIYASRQSQSVDETIRYNFFSDYEGDPEKIAKIGDIQNIMSSGTTAPSNPTEGQLWYDTTNDVLNVYDGTQWNEVGGGGGGEGNVKFFANTTAGLQEMYDWLYNSTGRYGIVQYSEYKHFIFGPTTSTSGRVYSAEGYKTTGLSFNNGNLVRDRQNVYYNLSNGVVTGGLGGVSSGSMIASGIATQSYVNARITSSSTAPSNPTEGQLWYDTTNDVLKAYDGTNWNEVNTDTTYSAGTGLTLNGTTFSADTTVLATKQDIADLGSFEVVASLPSVSSADTKTIYLLGPIGTGADKYEEWIVTNQISNFVKDGSNQYTPNTLTLSEQTTLTIINSTATSNNPGFTIDSNGMQFCYFENHSLGYDGWYLRSGGTWVFIDNNAIMVNAGTYNVTAGGGDTSFDSITISTGTGKVWTKIGETSVDLSNLNTKTFTITSTGGDPLTIAEAEEIYNWYLAGKNPIVRYSNMTFVFHSDDASATIFHPVIGFSTSNSVTTMEDCELIFVKDSGSILAVVCDMASKSYLDTYVDYQTPYTPLYNGSPATKKYVDDNIAATKSTGATAPSNPTEGQLWYDTTNDVLKAYDGTNWNEVNTDTTYTAGTGISIDANNVISSTQTGAEWGDITGTLADQTDLKSALDAKMEGMTILKYGTSTRNDFITAYNNNRVIYCRASSQANPASGSQTRLAFMAYVNNETTPTEVEFQYYRSRSDHNSAANQLDQVFVYKLTSASGGTWTVTERNTAAKAVAGTGISLAFGSGNMTISADTSVLATQTYVDGHDTVVSATAPSSPTEGQLWYDTTNNVLKSYDGTQWNTGVTSVNGDTGDVIINDVKVYPSLPTPVQEGTVIYNTTDEKLYVADGQGVPQVVGGEGNTKTFYISSTSDLTNAQAAYDWYAAGKNPIVIYNNLTYDFAYASTSSIQFRSNKLSKVAQQQQTGGYSSGLRQPYMSFAVVGGEVTSINTFDSDVNINYLDTTQNYTAGIYTPQYDGSPATKKYVDDNSFKLAPSSPLTPKYRRYGTQAQYEALSQYYTDTPGDTVYHTT